MASAEPADLRGIMDKRFNRRIDAGSAVGRSVAWGAGMFRRAEGCSRMAQLVRTSSGGQTLIGRTRRAATDRTRILVRGRPRRDRRPESDRGGSLRPRFARCPRPRAGEISGGSWGSSSCTRIAVTTSGSVMKARNQTGGRVFMRQRFPSGRARGLRRPPAALPRRRAPDGPVVSLGNTAYAGSRPRGVVHL